MAEDVLGLVPRGTHDFKKYISPEKLTAILQQHNCRVLDVKGMMYHPLSNTWEYAPDSPIALDVNYIMAAIKL